MLKYVLLLLVLFLSLLFLPLTGQAANELTFDADTTITIDDLDLQITIASGSVADSMTVNTDSVAFTLSSGSSVGLTAQGAYLLTNTLSLSVNCVENPSLTLPAQASQTEVTVTPTACVVPSASTSGGGGGGGGGAAAAAPVSAMPITTTGEITATASDGGKTTLTTDENSTAGVELPAEAVSNSTVVKITEEAKDEVISSRAVPTDKSMVGSYVYDYKATVDGEEITTFDESVTLIFTYRQEQVSGLYESSLKIYYWDESSSQWIGLETTVDIDTNTLTATTDHFTYFAIFGSEPEEEEAEEVTIVDGDLIRNPDAEGMAQFDIYIVKLVGDKKFKRLILSPHVFESYAHFDKNGDGDKGWNDVIDTNTATMDSYTTSDLVRADGDTMVYQLTADGDTGTKQWLNMTATVFISQGYDADSIYVINNTDRAAYTTGADIKAE